MAARTTTGNFMVSLAKLINKTESTKKICISLFAENRSSADSRGSGISPLYNDTSPNASTASHHINQGATHHLAAAAWLYMRGRAYGRIIRGRKHYLI